MRNWAVGRPGDLLMRAGGALLLLVSGTAIGTLAHHHAAHRVFSPHIFDLALAATGFLASSIGAALLALGHHVFDEVEVSERWRYRQPPRAE